MCQVNRGGSFSAPLGSETPESIHLKSGMFDYVHSPTSHAKYGVTIELRRLHLDLIYRYKIVFDIVAINFCYF